ncbi:desulfoferrodoxin [Candidatus Woesearchaeota archaeon CG10_big_fil_rev_8_21_14_0_10_34_12]|nr:MAG: desulfoferrodoxin [Candidatus Woesearchaeota archaeon CG10_big_fil_rev_8_21_14_0_10_34_12]
MTNINQVYKCEICGNITEVLHSGSDSLVCCGQPMNLLTERMQDEGMEKHLPVIIVSDGKVFVKVGSVEHPMFQEHYIEWIELIAGEKVYRKFLNPGDKPEAEFCITSEKPEARAYCNVHGLWKA